MEGIKDSYLCYKALFSNSVIWRDFFRPLAKKEEFFEVRYFQFPEALADSLVLGTGRGLGKSIGLECWFTQQMLKNRMCEGLLTSFRSLHVRDRMESIIGMFMHVPYFKHFLLEKFPIRRSPVYEIKLKTGVTAYGIAIGDDPQATNMVGKHCTWRAIEEAQFFPPFAYVQFGGTESQEGSVDRFIGVPDGRVDTPFRELDSDTDNNRLHLSRRFNPDMTFKKLEKQTKQYGGEGSGDFQNQVDGIWGEPVSSGWDLDAIKSCMILDPKHADYVPYVVNISKKQFDLSERLPEAFLYNLPIKNGVVRYLIAVDAGFGQPTVINVIADFGETFQLLARINLRDRMKEPEQEEILFFVFTEYDRRYATYISIDCTSGEGRSLADYLEKKIDPKRIHRVEFQSMVVTRKEVQDDGKEKEIKETMKEMTARVLKDLFVMRLKEKPVFVLPYDSEILEEFGAERRQRDINGVSRLITPTDIHIPESLRCFAYLVWWFYRKDKSIEDENSTVFILPEFGDTPGILRSSYA